jgi:Rrf2 family protein
MSQYGLAVEYALHALLNLSLASDDAGPSARDLAEFHKLPVAFMRKLLARLQRSGLVEATEGVHGGYRLRRPPEEITVLEIAEAVQGRAPLFECREIRARCALWPDDDPPRGARTGVCEIHAVMLAADRAMRAQLKAHTLADLTTRVEAKSPRFATGGLPEWFGNRYAGRRAPASDDEG